MSPFDVTAPFRPKKCSKRPTSRIPEKLIFSCQTASEDRPHHQGGHVASHSSRSGPAGAVAPHVARRLEPNQRKEARYAELAYSDPEMAEIALRNIERRGKHKVTRPEIKVGDMVRVRVKPIESKGSYRVNETAWSEKVQGRFRRERVAGKGGAQRSLKSPRKRSSRAARALFLHQKGPSQLREFPLFCTKKGLVARFL